MALEEAYKLDAHRTLAKIHHDSDYSDLRQNPEFEQSHVGRAYDDFVPIFLSTQKSHFKNALFEFDYPATYESTPCNEYFGPAESVHVLCLRDRYEGPEKEMTVTASNATSSGIV